VAGGHAIALFLRLAERDRIRVLHQLSVEAPLYAAALLYATITELSADTLEWARRTSRTCGLTALGTAAGTSAPAILAANVRSLGLDASSGSPGRPKDGRVWAPLGRHEARSSS
jgi:hypothetical protein